MTRVGRRDPREPSWKWLAGLVTGAGLCLGPSIGQGADFGINPAATYLRVESGDPAPATVPIALSALGITPGTFVRLQVLGDFNSCSGCPSNTDSERRMIAVFSSSSVLLAADQAQRVPGAIEAGADVVTATTQSSGAGLTTDIPQDFEIKGTDMIVQVPPGATHLFVAAHDGDFNTFYSNNVDPDGDYAIRILKSGPERVASRVALEPFDPTRWDSFAVQHTVEASAGQALLAASRKGGFNVGASSFTQNSRIEFLNEASVHSVEATVTLLDASVVGSNFPTDPRVSIDGYFYWDGTGTGTSTDNTGHVQANLGLRVSAAGGLPYASYFVSKCTDAPCNNATNLVGNTPLPVTIDFLVPYRLRLSFDPATGLFTFQVDDNPAVTFTAPDATRLPTPAPFMQLRARAGVPADPTSFASVVGFFDGVKVSGAAYDGFTPQILPRVQILPGSGTYPVGTRADVAIVVETAAGDTVAASGVRLIFNNQDVSNVVPSFIPGTLPSGGTTFRVPAFLLSSILTPNTPVLIAAEVTTASGAKGTGYALWRVIP